MKLAVICSNGKVGRLVVEEALKRGMEVTGFAKGENRSKAPSFVSKDLFDLKKEDLEGFDAVVDAFGIWDPKELSKHTSSLLHLVEILKGTKAKLFVSGGAGSLYVDKAKGVRLKDLPSFPAEYLPVASAMADALDQLKKVGDIPWLYVSPAADFLPDGVRTGKYRLCGDEYATDRDGASRISYADFALALVDLIEKSEENRVQVSAIWG